MLRRFSGFMLALGLLTLVGCSTDFEVYAPPKEIRSVFCILNPQDSVQYVRIAKAYQVQGDAIEYAGNNDLSVSGLQVKLTGAGKTWIASETTDQPKEEGLFLPSHTVYKFVTDGNGAGRDTLPYDSDYTLEIGAPDADDFLTAITHVPELPKIRGEFVLVAGAGTTLCLPRLNLERVFNFYWKNLDANKDKGINYEVRVGLNFEANGESQSVMYGPTDLFSDNRRCNEGGNSICYQFAAKELLRTFLAKMPEDPFINYTYDTSDSCVIGTANIPLMPRSLWFEVTAVDMYLSNYINVNNPAVLDINGSKPEYTNLTGNIDAVGVFGSYNKDLRYAILANCPEALLGLNGRQPTPGCNWDN